MRSLAPIPPHVGSCLKRALAAHDAADPASALEALTAGALADIQQHQQQFLGDIRACALFADFTRDLLTPWAASLPPFIAPPALSNPPRIAYCMPSLAQGQAASANLLRLVRHHAATKRVTCCVILTEEHTRRNPASDFLHLPDAPSTLLAPDMLAQLRTLCEVHILPAIDSHLAAAHRALPLLRALALDAALFVASPACAIQTALAFARIAPLQTCLNIGVPLLTPGIDAVIYNNPPKAQRDHAVLTACNIAMHSVETSGGDAASAAAVPATPRSTLALPADAPVLACVSNRLTDRLLAGTFAHDLCAFLLQHPTAWFVGIGPSDPGKLQAPLAPVIDRCIFTGPAADPRTHLKSCDILLNEYPEGGGNSVIEAMGAGVPVVAMRAGERHAECIGAHLVGPDAIPTSDRTAYWQLVTHWLQNPHARLQAAARQRDRAVTRLDYAPICAAYEDALLSLLGGRPLRGGRMP